MQCYQCKNSIPDNALFCSFCGSAQAKEPSKLVSQNTDSNNKTKPRKKKKHRFLRTLLFFVFVFFAVKGINAYRHSLNQIYLTNSKNNDDFYHVEDHLKKIKLSFRSFKKVKSSTIKVYSNQLTLLEESYGNQKTWILKNLDLPIGKSDLDIKIILNNGETIERHFVLYNTYDSNLGSLDNTDTDGDQLLNYQEDMFGTDKNNKDSDSDGLTDYQEVFLVNSNPLVSSTFNNGVIDSDSDFDNDQLSNLEEITSGTNALLVDSDSDGLTDYQEIKVYHTNANVNDSDNDGVSDYQEAINFNTDPNSKTDVFSGKVGSRNGDVSITLNDLSLRDIQNVVFEESDNPILSQNVVGYIMPAYDIYTDVSFSKSNLSFDFSNYSLGEGAQPTIYYYNEKTGLLEEMPTTIVGTTATTVVEHFSTYMLIDKKELSKINQVAVGSATVDVVKKINGEFTFFFSPLLAQIVNVPVEIYASPSISEEDAKALSVKMENLLGDGYTIKVKTIQSTQGFNVLKKIIDLSYDSLQLFFKNLELEDMLETEQISENSYIHSIGGMSLLVGYIQNVDDLYLSSLSEEKVTDDTMTVQLDDVDSNNDGIKDGHMIAIVSGSITTQTGINPFESCDLTDTKASRDYDGDGIINGEEIKIEELDGKYIVHMISNPCQKDSDSDGLEDSDDASPLTPLLKGFVIGKSLKERYDTSKMAMDVSKTNKLFGTGKKVEKGFIEYELDGEVKKSPQLAKEVLSGSAMGLLADVGCITGAADACKAVNRYLSSSAETYTEKDIEVATLKSNKSLNSNSILGSDDVQLSLNEQIKKLQHGVEENIKSGDTRVIKSSQTFTASGAGTGAGANLNVVGMLHTSSGYIVSEVSNHNDSYSVKLRFFILDKYDWKNSDECDTKYFACATEVYYYNQLLLGKGKAFLVNIEYDMDVSWNKGEDAAITFYDDVRYS